MRNNLWLNIAAIVVAFLFPICVRMLKTSLGLELGFQEMLLIWIVAGVFFAVVYSRLKNRPAKDESKLL